MKFNGFGRASAMGIALCFGGLSFGEMISPALADTRGGVDVALSGKAAGNPFGLVGQGDATAVSIIPEITPWLTITDPNTKVELRGDVYVEQYTRRYGRDATGSVDLNVKQQLSPQIGLRGGAHYTNSNVGLHTLLLNRDTAADAVTSPGTLLPDVTNAGFRTHVETISGRLGLDLAASELDNFNFDASVSRSRSNVAGSSDYYYSTGTLGYGRELSARTSATITLQYSDVNYAGKREGDGQIFSPQVGLKQKFSSSINLEVSGGASIAHIYRADGSAQNFTVVSGQVRLCDAIKNGALCLNAARTAQPTAIGGVSASTDVAIDVDRSLNRRDRISLTTRYARISQSSGLPGRSTEFLGIWGTFTRQYDERLSVFFSPSISQIFDGTPSRRANWQVNLGARYHFGAVK